MSRGCASSWRTPHETQDIDAFSSGMRQEIRHRSNNNPAAASPRQGYASSLLSHPRNSSRARWSAIARRYRWPLSCCIPVVFWTLCMLSRILTARTPLAGMAQAMCEFANQKAANCNLWLTRSWCTCVSDGVLSEHDRVVGGHALGVHDCNWLQRFLHSLGCV